MTAYPHTDFDPFERSLSELAAALHTGRTSAQALASACLARIDAFDRNGPAINAISGIHPTLMAEARALDDERRTRGPRSALHGMPMVVKDNIDTVGMPTTAGCAALAQAFPHADAACVARLRAAGAFVLAKANMSELAASNGRFGYSSASGLTLNPYRLSRNASGSSSGTGAAVAASFAAFGLGTDSFGSVRGPACVHALAGLRPTHGLLDNTGVLPLASAFDTVGPMGRYVADIELVMDVLAPGHGFGAQPATLASRRVAVVVNLGGGNAEVDALFAQAVTAIQAAGAATCEVRLPNALLCLYADLLGEMTRSQWARELDRYLMHGPEHSPRSATELVARIDAATTTAASAHPTNPLTLAALRHAIATRDQPAGTDAAALQRVRHVVEGIFAMHEADALVFPTQACPASPRFDMPDDPSFHCRAPQPLAAMHIASATGLPEVSVPMGFTAAGVPAGISWLGRAGTDAALLAMAAAFEQVTRHRRPPTHTPAWRPAGRVRG